MHNNGLPAKLRPPKGELLPPKTSLHCKMQMNDVCPWRPTYEGQIGAQSLKKFPEFLARDLRIIGGQVAKIYLLVISSA
jgi:hypothetical protein